MQGDWSQSVVTAGPPRPTGPGPAGGTAGGTAVRVPGQNGGAVPALTVTAVTHLQPAATAGWTGAGAGPGRGRGEAVLPPTVLDQVHFCLPVFPNHIYLYLAGGIFIRCSPVVFDCRLKDEMSHLTYAHCTMYMIE